MKPKIHTPVYTLNALVEKIRDSKDFKIEEDLNGGMIRFVKMSHAQFYEVLVESDGIPRDTAIERLIQTLGNPIHKGRKKKSPNEYLFHYLNENPPPERIRIVLRTYETEDGLFG